MFILGQNSEKLEIKIFILAAGACSDRRNIDFKPCSPYHK